MKAPPVSAPEVRLSIARLVVEGFSRLDARRVSDGFSQRLGELATSHARALEGLSSPGGSLTIPPLSVPADRSPASIGRAAAEALWRELAP